MAYEEWRNLKQSVIRIIKPITPLSYLKGKLGEQGLIHGQSSSSGKKIRWDSNVKLLIQGH